MENEFISEDGRQVWVSGEVVIDGVQHAVQAKYIKCDSSLNSRSWNTTEALSRCPICFPDSTISISQNQSNMDFFKRLLELSPELDLTLKMQRKGNNITMHVIPASDGIKSLELKGTAEDFDNGFFDAIQKPMEVLAGLRTNVSEFEASVKAAADKQKPAAPAKTESKVIPPPKKEDPKPKQNDPVVCPWLQDAKLVVTAPGQLRLREGFLFSTDVNEKGEVEVAFGHGHQWVAIGDLEPAKEDEGFQSNAASTAPEAKPAQPLPVGPPAPPPPPPPPAA